MSVSHYLCRGDLPIFCLFEAPFCLGWRGWKLLLSRQISSSVGAMAPEYLLKIKVPKGGWVCSDIREEPFLVYKELFSEQFLK